MGLRGCASPSTKVLFSREYTRALQPHTADPPTRDQGMHKISNLQLHSTTLFPVCICVVKTSLHSRREAWHVQAGLPLGLSGLPSYSRCTQQLAPERITHLQLITSLHPTESADDGIDLRWLQWRVCRGRREGCSGPAKVQPLILDRPTHACIRYDIQITSKFAQICISLGATLKLALT